MKQELTRQFHIILGIKLENTGELYLMLPNVGGVDISMSTLRRHLRPLGLLRHETQSDLLEASVFLQEKFNQYGMLHALCMNGSVDGLLCVCVWSYGYMLIQRLSIMLKLKFNITVFHRGEATWANEKQR